MFRTTAAFAVLCAILPPADATPAPNTIGAIRPDLGVVAWPATLEPADRAASSKPPELTVTDGTEVLVDGRDCEMAKVPATATVVRVEVGPDRKTILRIEFRTTK